MHIYRKNGSSTFNLLSGVTQDPEDEVHSFMCAQYEPLKGSYPWVFTSRAYRQLYSAHENKLFQVDAFFRTFLTLGGREFWSQLADFLIVCRNARLAFQEDFRTIRGSLDDFSDTKDGAVLSTHHITSSMSSCLRCNS
jgi:hypothetical protein